MSGMNYSIIQTNFYLNRAKIAESLCENKDKPELACDGLCVLEDRLSKEKERNEKVPLIEFQNFHYILPNAVHLEEIQNFRIKTSYFILDIQKRIFQVVNNFFQPPKF